MKNALFSVALLGMLIACNGKQNGVSPTEPAVKVAYQKSVRMGGTSLEMKLSAVADSRCPINARCITAGAVTVNFEATQSGTTQLVQVELPAYPDRSAQKTFSVGGQSYQLTLQEGCN